MKHLITTDWVSGGPTRSELGTVRRATHRALSPFFPGASLATRTPVYAAAESNL